MPNIANGVVAVYVGGDPLRVKGEVKYQPGGPMTETKFGPVGKVGETVTYAEPMMEFESTDGDDVDLIALQAYRGEVWFRMRNGKTFTLRDAAFEGAISGETSEGTSPCKFVGAEGLFS